MPGKSRHHGPLWACSIVYDCETRFSLPNSFCQLQSRILSTRIAMAGMSYPVLTSSQAPVFTGESGQPWRFFVEATAVRGRPTLIRKLFKNGGSVVNSAREADILLAEHNTKEALELLEAWCGDKVLLSTRWAARCLEERTFLGSDRGWAGCELTREVLLKGIVSSDTASEDEEEEEPRKPKRPHRTLPSSQSSTPSKSSTLSKQPLSEPGPSRSRTSNTASPTHSRKRPSSNSEQKQTPPKLRNSISQSPATPSLTMPVDIAPQTSPSQTALQQQQALVATMFNSLIQVSQQPPNPDLFSSLGQFTNFPQITPLLASSLQQYFTQQLPATAHALHAQHPEVAGHVDASSSTQESSTRPTPEDVDTDVVSDAASVRSEEGEVELSVSHRRAAKERATNGSSSDHEIQTAIRSNPPRSNNNKPRKKSGIFVDGQGNPLRFYIMVDLKNRKDLVKIVRTHNGTIVSQMNDADYIILNNRSNQFQKTLELLPIRSIALSPTWLEECEKMGTLAELGSHVIDITSGVGRGLSRRKPIAAKRRPIQGECESEEEVPKRLRQPATPQKPLPTIKPRDGTNDARSRSPSPLAPTPVMAPSPGKFMFTEEDRIWYFKYARAKLERDPYMTRAALLRAVASKAPHHSLKSWDNMTRTKWAGEMRALKEEMAIPRGETSTTFPSPSSSPKPRDTQTELVYPETSPAPVPNQSSFTLPSSSRSTWLSSQAEPSPCTNLKRKEPPSEDQVDLVAVEQYSKRFKTEDEVVNVDLYPDV
ncbi:hypothetical protein JB92DRAFT_2854436 [Gautieria morchelliformis]|nr:hypothetical protein JB92DRAFT_2854436 [Gautieria morchelliformis]